MVLTNWVCFSPPASACRGKGGGSEPSASPGPSATASGYDRRSEKRAQLTAATLPETLPAASEPRGDWHVGRLGRTRDQFDADRVLRPACRHRDCRPVERRDRRRRRRNAVEQFYKGKQISVIVGSSPGGGYDTYARLLARHFGSAIPGNPTVVVQNMSGAGSNRAAGYIYSVAPKDGTADRRDLPRRGAATAAQRRAGAARSEQARLSRQRQQRRLCLLRAQRCAR